MRTHDSDPAFIPTNTPDSVERETIRQDIIKINRMLDARINALRVMYRDSSYLKNLIELHDTLAVDSNKRVFPRFTLSEVREYAACLAAMQKILEGTDQETLMQGYLELAVCHDRIKENATHYPNLVHDQRTNLMKCFCVFVLGMALMFLSLPIVPVAVTAQIIALPFVVLGVGGLMTVGGFFSAEFLRNRSGNERSQISSGIINDYSFPFSSPRCLLNSLGLFKEKASAVPNRIASGHSVNTSRAEEREHPVPALA